MGDISIKPESSDNLNFNLSYNRTFGRHSVYMEGGVIYRNTKDYIQRNIADLSGGKYAAKYINYGKVLTKGYTVSARYGFGNWVSIGANFTKMDVCDNMKHLFPAVRKIWLIKNGCRTCLICLLIRMLLFIGGI